VQNDPLWNLRHALAGVALALLLSVPVAALLGNALGDWLGGTYGWRAGIYSGLLLYVVTGAFVLFVKVAQHERRPLSAARVGLWLASLWMWPGLLMMARRPAQAADVAGPPPGAPSAPDASAPGPSAPNASARPSAAATPSTSTPQAASAPAPGAASPPAPPSA
jgi:hypothetical protein